MGERFEVWASGEIERHISEAERHRNEAAQLERVLAQFLSANERAPSAKPASHESTATPEPRRRRSSKNDALIDAFEKAGPAGIDMDQLEKIAQSHGLNSDRHALRAYCWHQKKAGLLVSLAPGRHAIAPKDEAADPAGKVEESAASNTTNDAVMRGEVEHEKMTV